MGNCETLEKTKSFKNFTCPELMSYDVFGKIRSESPSGDTCNEKMFVGKIEPI